jgi:transposase-like protein
MNFTQQQVSEILDQIASGQNGYQQILKYSVEAIMRAERHEFNEKQGDSSNGYRFRSVLGHGGKLELMVPRSRHHNFYPMILALIKDQESESRNLAYELYSSGLTGEQIGGIFEQVYGQHYSKASVSNMMQTAREDVFQWLDRGLERHYPILYIDATYWYTRRDESVSNEAYYSILAVKEDGTREVIALVNHPTEGSTNWKDAFEALKKRGLQKVSLVVCDGLTGIENVIAAVFPESDVQLCTVHLARNIQAKVKPVDKQLIATDLKVVLNPERENDNPTKGYERFVAFIGKWIIKYPSLKSYLEPRNRLYFTYLGYNVQIRRMIYTTNWIERLNRNYKRTLRMRSSMPSPESVLFLLGSVAMKRKEYNFPIYQLSFEPKLFPNFGMEKK